MREKKSGVFITGTDTNIGKTIVSSLIVSALRSRGVEARYLKPVQTGMDSDTLTVAGLTGVSIETWPQPFYFYPEPMAPSRAAALHSDEIQLDLILRKWMDLEDGTWVVEGAGGLLVPLNSHQMIRDLVVTLDLPLVIVASSKLGTLNHTFLTLEAAETKGITVAGIVVIGDEDPGLDSVFRDHTKVPVIRLPYLNSISEIEIKKAATQIPVSFLKSLTREL